MLTLAGGIKDVIQASRGINVSRLHSVTMLIFRVSVHSGKWRIWGWGGAVQAVATSVTVSGWLVGIRLLFPVKTEEGESFVVGTPERSSDY